MADLIEVYKGVNILALGAYRPVSGGSHDSFSRLILDFKDGRPLAIQEMIKRVSHLLSSSSVATSPFYIATIPSSTAGRAHSGFPELISELSENFQIQNSTRNLLRRTASKRPAHQGGSRSKEDLIATLEVPSEVKIEIQGKPVIILDDVTTSGNSLKAGIDLLIEAQARVIAAIAVGKTTR